MDIIYLDHAATTPLHPMVIEEMMGALKITFGNPSSIHTHGRKARTILDISRQLVAKSIGAKEQEIIFNSGGSEGDNTAIIQTALKRKSEGNHLITTAVEHPAVLESMKFLEENGFEVTYLPVDEKGNLSLDTLEEALREDTILVSIMYGNNETGVLFPIKEIGELLKNHPAYFHTDAVQAYGIESINVKELQIDLLTASGHKINGPKGVGFLYMREGIHLPPYIHGGSQEDKRRAGTENIPNIFGFAKAAELLTADEKSERRLTYQNFEYYILNELKKNNIDYQINGDATNKLPHILNLHLKDISNDLLLLSLDLKGVCLSIGSACTAGNVKPSHVLKAMHGDNEKIATESIRISFGYGNTMKEMEDFMEILLMAIYRLKK